MDAITFTVDGPPVPQPRARISTWGGRGRAYTPKDHAIHPYRQAIAIRATLAAKAAGWAVTDRPVVLEVLALFSRPASHLTKSVKGPAQVRRGAPAFPPRNDWDNLGKAVSDAITDSGAVWADDDQVVDARVLKRYTSGTPRTVVTIREAGPWPDAS